jgi:hypothetical protein
MRRCSKLRACGNSRDVSIVAAEFRILSRALSYHQSLSSLAHQSLGIVFADGTTVRHFTQISHATAVDSVVHIHSSISNVLSPYVGLSVNNGTPVGSMRIRQGWY